MAGNRRNAVNWLVDGASNVDVGSNITLLATPTIESIEEFKIITTGYNAEWPRSGGGIVNIVTKSGSNQFRATGYEFFRDDALNANSWIRNQSTDPRTAEQPGRTQIQQLWLHPRRPDRQETTSSSSGHRSGARSPAPQRHRPRPPSILCGSPIPPTPTTWPRLTATRMPWPCSSLWPAPNVGTNSFQETRANDQDTRQEVLRMDWQANEKWRVMGRYTHDLSKTTEPGGLFFNALVPERRPRHSPTSPASFRRPRLRPRSGRRCSTSCRSSSRVTPSPRCMGMASPTARDQFNIAVPELFTENRNALIPTILIDATRAVAGRCAPVVRQLLPELHRSATTCRGSAATTRSRVAC